MQSADFEACLTQHKTSVERFVRYRLSGADADDVLQETYIAAHRNISALRSRESFLPWILSIARNKCRDHYRGRKDDTVSLETAECEPEHEPTGIVDAVRETLDVLPARDREVLILTYFDELPQAEIAARLNIPVGTVKSRLHAAKRRFRDAYLCRDRHTLKGDNMEKNTKKTTLPDIMPEYTITSSEEAPFAVRWEEIMGWMIVPRIGEELSWAAYDFPSRKRTELCEVKVVGRAQVHGIEGVEIVSTEYEPMECNSAGGQKVVERHFVAQLTDTHCRFLAESETYDGIKRFFTFLDGDAFLNNWGFGPDNCGKEVNIAPKGDIVKDGDALTVADGQDCLDVVGRYTVMICGREYDTVCVVDCGTYESHIVTEQYLDKNGRTVLWRRFNRDDWAYKRYGKKWTEMLPDNERMTVNGEVYVHWYDCISDYIM